jgi:uncharacterized membrane protein YcaP (DUF421 family)
MSNIWQIDWHTLFIPSGSIIEIIFRGSVIYLLLFVIMRILRREAGQLSVADILVVVIIADASQNGMAGEYKSITEGIILIITIFIWDYVLDWLGLHNPFLHRFLHPKPIILVHDGHIDWKKMRKHLISKEELMSFLRQEGVQKIEDVHKCYLEDNGNLSVITNEKK